MGEHHPEDSRDGGDSLTPLPSNKQWRVRVPGEVKADGDYYFGFHGREWSPVEKTSGLGVSCSEIVVTPIPHETPHSRVYFVERLNDPRDKLSTTLDAAEARAREQARNNAGETYDVLRIESRFCAEVTVKRVEPL